MAQRFPSAEDIEARIFIPPPAAFASTSSPIDPRRTRTGSWSSSTPILPSRHFTDSPRSSNANLTMISTSNPSHPYASAYIPPSPYHSNPNLQKEASFSSIPKRSGTTGFYDPEALIHQPATVDAAVTTKKPFWARRTGIIWLISVILVLTVAAIAGPAIASAFAKVHDSSASDMESSGSGGGGGSSTEVNASPSPVSTSAPVMTSSSVSSSLVISSSPTFVTDPAAATTSIS